MNINRLIHRYLFASLGAFLAMFFFILSVNAPNNGWLDRYTWSFALGPAFTFGHLFGFMVVFSSEIPSRLTKVPALGRFFIGLIGGGIFATLTWLAYHLFFLNNMISLDVLLIGVLALNGAHWLALFWKGKSIARVLSLTLVSMLILFLPIWYYQVQWVNTLNSGDVSSALMYYLPNISKCFLIVNLIFSSLIAAFAHLPTLWIHRDLPASQKQKRKNEDILADSREWLMIQEAVQVNEPQLIARKSQTQMDA